MRVTHYLRWVDVEKQSRYDRAYLRMAREWAALSHCQRKQVGALIVREGMIVSDGYNGTPSGMPNACENEREKPIGMCCMPKPMPSPSWQGPHTPPRAPRSTSPYRRVVNAPSSFIKSAFVGWSISTPTRTIPV